jgi:hypothetical protein
MKRAALLIPIGFALLGLAPTAVAADRRVTMTCAQQSEAAFPRAYRSPVNMVVGPLAWIGAHNNAGYDGAYESGYRWKNPVVVRPGHTVTMRIGAAAKTFAGLTYDHDGGWSFGKAERTVVFKACSRARAASRVDGKPVTFWSGGIVSTRTAVCVPIEFRVDDGAVRRRSIGLGASC